MSDFPEPGQFGGHSSCQAEAMVVYVHPCWPCGYFCFGRDRTDKDEVLNILAKVVCDLHLPLYETLPGIKGEYHCHVLANDSDGIWFLVQCEPRFDSEELLKGQRCLCLSVFIPVLGVSVQLQMKAIWKFNGQGKVKNVIFYYALSYAMPIWVIFTESVIYDLRCLKLSYKIIDLTMYFNYFRTVKYSFKIMLQTKPLSTKFHSLAHRILSQQINFKLTTSKNWKPFNHTNTNHFYCHHFY